MHQSTIGVTSIILLLLGSIFMLAAGFGLISFKYAIFAGIVCFMVFVFIEVISRKKN